MSARCRHETTLEEVLAHPHPSVEDLAVLASSGASNALFVAICKGSALWQHLYGLSGPAFPIDQ